LNEGSVIYSIIRKTLNVAPGREKGMISSKATTLGCSITL